MTVIARAAGFVHPPPGNEIACAGVGGGILAGDIADGLVGTAPIEERRGCELQSMTHSQSNTSSLH